MENTREQDLKALYGSLYDEQLTIEAEFKNRAMEACREMFRERKVNGEAASLSLGQQLIRREFGTVLENVKVFIDYTLKPKRGVKPAYHYIIQDLAGIYEERLEELYGLCAFATFTTLIDSVFGRHHDLSALTSIISSIIQEEAQLEAFRNAEEKEAGITLKGLEERHKRLYRSTYVRKRMEHLKFTPPKWLLADLKHLGAKLIELTMDGCGYFEYYHPVDSQGRDKPLEIRPTQWLLDTWAKNEGNTIDKAFFRCPCVIPPDPWQNFYDGGYYGDMSSSERLLRVNTATGGIFSKEYIKKLDQVDLSSVMAAVNAIQATPWKVNGKIFEVVEALIDRGGDIAEIPRLEPLPELPRLPEGYTEDELKAHKKKKVERIHLENNRRGRAARALAIFRMAARFKDYEKIYFPHNMDFRGRVYPITSFGPQGDDLTKSLLMFTEAPPCETLEDIGWMMVHGANLAGIDKVSYADRKAWIVENETHILQSAQDPLSYTWWANQDKPLQFLGFCFEWLKWKQWEQEHAGNPKGFITGLAVAFDGTCSGLQHFSAILRDPIGGAAVNLVPGDKPRDIYKVVAEEVNKRLQKDAATGTLDEERSGVDKDTEKEYTFIKYGTKTLAQQWLSFGVDRKVTKRPVMTLAYGSKEYGFREQILVDTIRPAIDEGRGGMFKGAPQQAAGYMAKLIWQSVQDVVVAAVDGMKWLQEVARLVCKEGRPVTWVTPMGLPVQQHYIEGSSEMLRLRIGGKKIKLYTYAPTGNIDKKAQAQAIAPNFIHSMDAAHLQLTVLTANEKGVKHFAMIHDSYGAPVAHARLMYAAVRESFVQMYDKKDMLGAFRDDMEPYVENNVDWPPFPESGNLKITAIIESEYTFS